VVKTLPASAGDVRDMGLIPGLGRSPEGGHGNPLQCSCLGSPMHGGAWRATVRGATESWMRLSTKHTYTVTREVCGLMQLDRRQKENETCDMQQPEDRDFSRTH